MTMPSASSLATDSMAAMNPPARTIATASAPSIAVTSGAIRSRRRPIATVAVTSWQGTLALRVGPAGWGPVKSHAP